MQCFHKACILVNCMSVLFSAVIHMESHPGIPNLAVIATRAGKLSLVSLPVAGTAQPAKDLGTWLDLSSRVDSTNAEGGFLSFAFHPNFNQNGRFFVSYTCDARKVPDCQVSQTPMCLVLRYSYDSPMECRP